MSQPWSIEALNVLFYFYKTGQSTSEIAALLGKSTSSINHKLDDMDRSLFRQHRTLWKELPPTSEHCLEHRQEHYIERCAKLSQAQEALLDLLPRWAQQALCPGKGEKKEKSLQQWDKNSPETAAFTPDRALLDVESLEGYEGSLTSNPNHALSQIKKYDSAPQISVHKTKPSQPARHIFADFAQLVHVAKECHKVVIIKATPRGYPRPLFQWREGGKIQLLERHQVVAEFNKLRISLGKSVFYIE